MRTEVVQKQNIFSQFFFWYFIEMSKNILKTWKDIFRFYLNYFSIPLLLKTFFAPWRHSSSSYPKGFDLGKYSEILISNLISRSVGMILRFFLILTGLLVEILIALAAALTLFTWLTLPLGLIAGLCLSLGILF